MKKVVQLGENIERGEKESPKDLKLGHYRYIYDRTGTRKEGTFRPHSRQSSELVVAGQRKTKEWNLDLRSWSKVCNLFLGDWKVKEKRGTSGQCPSRSGRETYDKGGSLEGLGEVVNNS